MKKILFDKRVLFVIQFLGSAACIWYVFKKMDFSQLLGTLKEVDIFWFSIYVVFVFFTLFLYVYRWQIVNNVIGIKVGYGDLFKIYMISYFFSNFLPGSLGGDIYRGYILSKRSNSLSKSVMSVFFERGIGLYVMFFLGMCVSLLFIGQFPIYIPAFFFITIFTVTIGIFIFIKFNVVAWISKFKIFNFLLPVLNSISDFIETSKKSKKETIIIIATTVAYQLLQTGAVIFLYYSIDTSPDFLKMLSLCILVAILVNIPISINGIGFREALFMQFAFTVAVAPEKNIIISVMLYISNLIYAMIGLFFYAHKKYVTYIKKGRKDSDKL